MHKQADALADDVAIDFDVMSLWTEEQVSIFFESGGTALPAQSSNSEGAVAVPRRNPSLPLRFLCLHGGGSNEKVAKTQVATLSSLLGADAVFDFLEGPRVYPDDEVDKQLKVTSACLLFETLPLSLSPTHPFRNSLGVVRTTVGTGLT